MDSTLRFPPFLKFSFEKIGLIESGFIAQCNMQRFKLALFTIQDWKRQFHGKVFEGYALSNSKFVLGKTVRQITKEMCKMSFPDPQLSDYVFLM